MKKVVTIICCLSRHKKKEKNYPFGAKTNTVDRLPFPSKRFNKRLFSKVYINRSNMLIIDNTSYLL